MSMNTPSKLMRACKSTMPCLSSSRALSTSSRRGFASLIHAGRASHASSSSVYRVLATPAAARQVQWRSLQSSSRCLAEEVKGIGFESNIMNLLANNEEFRNLVNDFADRMKELLNIDVHAGQMPSMSDMMRCAQDQKLKELSERLTKILQADGVNLSPDTLKMIWNNMQGKGGQ